MERYSGVRGCFQRTCALHFPLQSVRGARSLPRVSTVALAVKVFGATIAELPGRSLLILPTAHIFAVCTVLTCACANVLV